MAAGVCRRPLRKSSISNSRGEEQPDGFLPVSVFHCGGSRLSRQKLGGGWFVGRGLTRRGAALVEIS